jgi:murein DD-endopeptidase MepM/ murein hydrolase activator NlpD
MIADLIRLSALYVLTRVFVEIAMPSLKHIVKYLFYTGIVLTVVSTIGPCLAQVASDIHEVTLVYTEVKKGVGVASDGVNAVTSLPDKMENIPYVGVGASKYPPGITLLEKIKPSTIKFNYPLSGKITQVFKGEDHHGIDIDCKEGTVVKASREGKVVNVGLHEIYGNYVHVDHGSGWSTLYAHLSKVSVEKGDKLWGNALKIGLSGNTGKSTGPHLHFEIRQANIAQDPKKWMKQ